MRNHAKSYRVLTGTLLLSATALAGACDDPNFFGTEQDPPEIVDFVPDQTTVAEGDTLTYSFEARGSRNIEQIRVKLSGAFDNDTTFGVDDPATNIDGTLKLLVSTGTFVPELTAEAWAIDVADDTSAEAATADPVTITDATPPTVSVSPTPSQVGSGDRIQIRVNAEDARGLASVAVEVTNGIGYDTTLTEAISGSPREYSETWELTAPDVQISTLTFTPTVEDINGLTNTGTAAEILLSDRSGPAIVSMITRPDSTIPLGDSLQVEVTVQDPAGITQISFIGLAERGDPSMGTDSVVERFTQKTITLPRPTEPDTLPKLYTFDPYLTSTDSETTEPVEVIVVVEDSLGNVSDTTKFMYVGGPDVSLSYPPEGFGVAVGDSFNVRVAMDDGTSIDSAKLILTGGKNETIDLTPAFPIRTDTPFVVTQQVLMPGSAGTVTLQAVAWNTAEVQGQSARLDVDVLTQPPGDTVPPVVSVTAQRLTPAEAETRMELLDEFRIRVSAFDGNAGVSRLGIRIISSRGTAKDTVDVDETLATPSKSLEELVFQIPVDSLYTLFGETDVAVLDSLMPENIDMRIHGFAADSVDNVACSVGIEEQRSCTVDGTFYEAADTTGLGLRVTAVRGNTVLLDNTDAIVADLAIDTVSSRERLFLSNVTENLVEWLSLDTDPRSIAFQPAVQVGSEPVGLFLGERVVSSTEIGFGGIGVTAGDTLPTLLVANSGGTNISLVHMDASPSLVQEVDVIRLRTPNAVLFQLKEETDDFGNVQYTGEWLDLADRPQFLAQDSLLRLVYSTRGTSETEITTVRFAHVDPDPTSSTDQPEVRYLLTEAMVDTDSETDLVLANVDSIDIRELAGTSDLVRVYMHKPGYPDQVIYNTPYLPQIEDALDSLILQIDTIMANRGMTAQAPMFYPFLMRGTWNLDALTWGDTTFVSASGDRGKIALGEGARDPVGRIMIWDAAERANYSDAIEMEDLTNNAAEVVLGVGLNQDGSLGVARGNEATYFFDDQLRLQGLYRQTELGGAGATFHPDHDAITDGGHTDVDSVGVAFTGTSEHSIDIVNTFHFNQVGTLTIRDNIVGPLRAGPPLAADNGGLGATCVTSVAAADKGDCIVAKLYGITSAGGVVIVNVRFRDLRPTDIQ
jgi:hypothetical protein